MSFYATQTAFAAPAALDTAVHIKSSATVRSHLSEFTISSPATPVEQSGSYTIIRTTSAGTTPVATLTVEKLNEYGPAAGSTAEGNGYTTEPTVGDIMMRVSVHQKATFRWVAYPGREISSLLVAANGIGITVISQSAAFAIDVSVVWME